MAASLSTDEFYFRNGGIYKIGFEPAIQDAVYKSMHHGFNILRSEGVGEDQLTEWEKTARAAEEVAEGVAEGVEVVSVATAHAIVHTIADPWFWVSMHQAVHLSAIHGGGCGGCGDCGGCGGCGGGKCDGQGVLAALLLAVVAALIIAIAVAVGFTVHQSIEAEKIKAQIDEIKKLKKEAQALQQAEIAKNVQDVYNKMLPIIQENHAQEALKATFTASLAIGFGLFTAAAIVALYCIFKRLPMSNLATQFAIGGGCVTAAAIAAHCIRPLIYDAHKEKREEMQQELFKSLYALFSKNPDMVIHPKDVLLHFKGVDKLYLEITPPGPQEEVRVYVKTQTLVQSISLSQFIQQNWKEDGYTKLELVTKEPVEELEL
jgi:hypothetical protein